MERQLILNRIQTPDGTILTSNHRHDYVCHTDKNGLYYFLDGGRDYRRMSNHEEAPHIDLAVYSDAPFKVIREHFCRGTHGKDGRGPLRWVPLNQMNDEWVAACITYNEERNMGKSYASSLYAKELKYRKRHKITIEE
jgi:hypothetical protein